MKFAKHSIFGRRVGGFHANFLGHGWRGVIVACQIPREWIANAILLVFVKLFNHLTSFSDLSLNTKLRLYTVVKNHEKHLMPKSINLNKPILAQKFKYFTVSGIRFWRENSNISYILAQFITQFWR